jgi:hypothetical protein
MRNHIIMPALKRIQLRKQISTPVVVILKSSRIQLVLKAEYVLPYCDLSQQRIIHAQHDMSLTCGLFCPQCR